MAEDEEKEGLHQLFSLDTTQQASFCDFFRSLPKVNDMVRFFSRNNYYTVHGENCEYIARQYIRTDRCIQMIGPKSDPLPSCIVNGKLFDEIICDLWKKARIEVWEHQGRTWEVIKTCSPGNTDDFADIIAGDADTSVVIAVKYHEEAGRLKVSCAYCNATQRELGIGEFIDGDQMLNFETFCIQVGAKECLLPAAPKGASTQANPALDVLKGLGVVATEIRRTDFASKSDTWSVVSNLLREGSAISEDLQVESLASVLGALVKYLRIDTDANCAGQFSLKKVDLHKYMRLDAITVRALSLFPDTAGPFEQISNRQAGLSLFGLLNQCHTSMGSRTLKQWISQPLMDLTEIARRQDFIELFTEDVLFKQAVRDILRKVPDLDALVRKFRKKGARIVDIVAIGKLLTTIAALNTALGGYSGVHVSLLQVNFIDPLAEILLHVETLQQLITSTLDFSDPSAVVIAPSFDEELQDLATNRSALDKKVEKVYRHVREDLGMDTKSLKLEKNQQSGNYFKVSQQKDGALRNSKGYTILETRKDGVRFTCPELLGLNKTCRDLHEAYEKRQSDIEEKLLDTVASYMPLLEDIAEYVSVLDIVSALAHVALQAPVPYTRPTVLPAEKAVLHLIGARHPMLETQCTSNYIANDVILGLDTHIMQLVTGPNMGGKSTYLRTAALLQHMAQMGMFLPCRSAIVSVRNCILARVGAADYQCRGVSTFMAEMIETANILNTATSGSLVIIDELGRGTSTNDGFGLAWAIAIKIAGDIGAFCLFATHFHELTTLPQQCPKIGNLHVTADTTNDQLVMLYEVKPGPCSKSFGIHVAELAHFPEVVVERAKRKAAELEGAQSLTNTKRSKDNDGAVAAILIMAKEAQSKILEFGDYEEASHHDAALNLLQALKQGIEQQIASCPSLQTLLTP